MRELMDAARRLIIGLGSDLCNIERIAEVARPLRRAVRAALLHRHRAGQGGAAAVHPRRDFAKRFAAKEAFSKAVGTGFKGGVFMKDIGVVNAPSGAPTLALTGGAARRLARWSRTGHEAVVHLTLTDDHPWAQAFVVIEARPMMSIDRSDGDRSRSARPPSRAGATDAEPPEQAKSKASTGGTRCAGSRLMLLAVLAFHSFIAKPFYIPSDSMMPPAGRRPAGGEQISLWLELGLGLASTCCPKRGTWRIGRRRPNTATSSSPCRRTRNEDYIKRVIGLPGDRIAVVNGQIILNGKPVPHGVEPPVHDPGRRAGLRRWPLCLSEFDAYRTRRAERQSRLRAADLRETLPNGASYRSR